MLQYIRVLLVALSATGLLSMEAQAVSVTIPLQIPDAKLDYDWTVGCSNKGPTVGFKGQTTLYLGKQSVYVRLRNNVKNTQLLEVTGEAAYAISATDTGENPFVYNKQPSAGGAGGNPYIYLFGPNKTVDSLLTGTQGVYYFGRCNEKSSGHYKDKAKVFSDLSFELLASDCGASKTGLSLNSSKPSSSVDGNLYFDNNQIYGGNTSTSAVKVGVGFVGPTLASVKNSHAGAGGNPLVSYQILECSGVPTSVDPSWLPGDPRIALARQRDLFNCRAYKDGISSSDQLVSVGGVSTNLNGHYKDNVTGLDYAGGLYCPQDTSSNKWHAATTASGETICSIAKRTVNSNGDATFTNLASSDPTVNLIAYPSEEKRCNKWTP